MKIIKRLFWFAGISIILIAADLDESIQFGFHIIQTAEARVGNPVSPASVSGVRRRTRRRTRRRVAVGTAAVVAPRPVVVAPVVAPRPVRYY
ncbi:MAG: hypothetical protein GQ581_06000 [Methyloprofundus sp.]|nr:hypothetical protein [Methyloprofundus sp.]